MCASPRSCIHDASRWRASAFPSVPPSTVPIITIETSSSENVYSDLTLSANRYPLNPDTEGVYTLPTASPVTPAEGMLTAVPVQLVPALFVILIQAVVWPFT
jgi:hypothetical protein